MSAFIGAGPREIRLKDLRPGEEGSVILARVLSADRREVTRRSDGGRRPVLSGLLSDGSATVRFTWWDPPKEGVERGTVLRATQFTIREFGGRSELSFNWRTKIEEASEVELPEPSAAALPLRPLAELRAGEEGFRVRVRLLGLRAKSVRIRGERRELYEGEVADRSGVMGFTSWADFRLKAGETVEIALARISVYRGARQLVLDGRSVVERLDAEVLPESELRVGWPKRRLAELEAERGAERVEAEGRVVGLMPPSGVVYRCPQCARTIEHGSCRQHGPVAGTPDLRTRLILDDGTAAVTVNAGRAETERLSGRSLEEFLRSLRDRPDPALVEEELHDRLFGRRLRVRGQATADSFGVTLTPIEIEELPTEDVRALEAEVTHLARRVRGGGA